MADVKSTSSYLDPPKLIGRPNSDGTISLTPLELKGLSDFNYYVAKMLQGGLNLANLNAATNEVFTDIEGNVTTVTATAEGLTTRVSDAEENIVTAYQTATSAGATASNALGQAQSVQLTVNGLSIADETGSYTIIDGDKLTSKDHDSGAATVIENGEIKVYSDLETFFWAGSLGYAYPGVFLIQNLSSSVPLKINGIGNMSIDATEGDAIYLGTGNSGEVVNIGNTNGTVNLVGTVYHNGNPLGAAVFT